VEKNFVPVVIASSSGTAYSGTLLRYYRYQL